jgi:hypothetical protein
LVLRHELAVLRRRSARSRIERADRALLATLSQAFPRPAWAVFFGQAGNGAALAPSAGRSGGGRIRATSRGGRRWNGRGNPSWGYERIAGELKQLDLAVSPTTVRKAGLRRRSSSPRAGTTIVAVVPAPTSCQHARLRFLHRRNAGPTAIYVLFFVSLATRRLEFVACTPNPGGAWVHPAGSQPRHAARGAEAQLRLADPRPRHEVQPLFRRDLSQRVPSATIASTAFSSSDAATSNEFCASTPTTTTSTGPTARSSSSLQTAASPTRKTTGPFGSPSIAATCSAD